MSMPDTRSMLIRSVAEADAAMQRALLQAARDAERVIQRRAKGVGDRVSQAQILRILSELREISHELWGEKIPDSLARLIALAEQRSQLGADALDGIMLQGVSDENRLRDIKASIQQRAKRVVQVFQTRERMARFQLSSRVYKWEHWHNGRVDQIVSSQFALGSSGREIARAVRDFIDPNTRGGASYAAKRLGRTEVANAFHEQTKRDYADNPFVTGLKWNLSRSHPGKDPCDLIAKGHSRGMQEGVYRVNQVPDKPHPQCMCHTTPETVSEEDFQDGFIAGQYDEYLVTKYPDIDPADLPSQGFAEPVAPAVKTRARVDKPMNKRTSRNKDVQGKRRDNKSSVNKWWSGLSQKERDRVRKGISDQSKKDFNVRMSQDALRGFIDEGRYKSVHEIAGKKGEDYLKTRKDYEDDIMGFSGDIEDRPIYGYYGDVDEVSSYGDYAITLKKRVRDRTTASAGDSLNGMLDVYPVDKIDDLTDAELRGMIGAQETIALQYEGKFVGYMEGQARNVTTEDVEFITVLSDAPTDFIQFLKRKGFKVKVQLTEEDQLLADLRKKMGG